MKFWNSILLAVAIALSLFGCENSTAEVLKSPEGGVSGPTSDLSKQASPNLVPQKRRDRNDFGRRVKVSDFTSIEARGPMNVDYKGGTSPSVVIRTDRGSPTRVKAFLRGKVLVIDADPKLRGYIVVSIGGNGVRSIRVADGTVFIGSKISAPELTLSASAGCRLLAQGEAKKITVYGSAGSIIQCLSAGTPSVTAELNTNTSLTFAESASLTSLSCSQASMANFPKLVGNASRVRLGEGSAFNAKGALLALKLDISGASTGNLQSLSVKSLEVNASGASKVFAWVTGKIQGLASEASSITYRGSPRESTVKSTDSSSITAI